MLCITLDKDGKESSREEKPKRWVPRNGFQKGADGNFYKKLGDPRNITDQEIRAFLLEEKRKKEERERQIPPPLPPIRSQLPAPACSQPSTFANVFTSYLVSAKTYDLQDFKNLIKYKQYTPRGLTSNNVLEYRHASLKNVIGIVTIDRIPMFDKIEIHPNEGIVKFWIRWRSNDIADYAVRKLVNNA